MFLGIETVAAALAPWAQLRPGRQVLRLRGAGGRARHWGTRRRSI